MLTSGAAGLVPRLAAGDILPLRELFRAGEPGELHLHRVRQRARRLRPGLPRPLPQPRSHRLHGAGRQQGEPGELCQGAGERGRGDPQEELQRAPGPGRGGGGSRGVREVSRAVAEQA